MQINVYSIEKREDYKKEIEGFIKKSTQFATVKDFTLFSKKLAKSEDPKKTYSEIFKKYIQNGINVILSPEGKLMDSYEFSKIFEHSSINFFIAGAYGFDNSFKKNGKLISLSPLTMSHKIAKLVLFEQIYRGLSIKNHHPYHK